MRQPLEVGKDFQIPFVPPRDGFGALAAAAAGFGVDGHIDVLAPPRPFLAVEQPKLFGQGILISVRTGLQGLQKRLNAVARVGEQRPAGFGVLVDGVDFLQPEPLAQAVPDLYALVFVRNRFPNMVMLPSVSVLIFS